MAEEVNMTLRDDGRARTPGLLGNVPGGVAGRRPGPLGFGSWVMATPVVTTALTTMKMPKPAHDGKTKLVRAVPWPLGKDKPAPGDIQQTVLANCAAASILAALANTVSGRPRISALVDEHAGAVVTDLSDVLGELAEPPKEGKQITSNRYFTVTLTKGSTAVSDVFYTNEGDRDSWSMIYMDSPNHKLWPCVIEKGYAVILGNDYDKLNSIEIDGQKPYLPANEVWNDLVGKPPDSILKIEKDTDLSKIKAAAAAAQNIPTIAASRDTAKKVTGYHGFTVLGPSGSGILLYDPEQANQITLSLEEFRSDFKNILYGNP
jgi:hypothetical protein